MRDAATGLARRHAIVHTDDLPATQGVVAFLSTQKREGAWQLAPATRVVSVLGNVELDLREADLSGGESVIEVFCVLGNVEIIVPPGIRVLHDGDSLAGSFEVKPGDWSVPSGAPTVRVTGTTYLGNVEVRQQAFGESEREARRRVRRLKRG